MAKQGTSKRQSLHNDLDSDFDLDDFIDEKTNQSDIGIESEEFNEERTDLIKNSLLVVAVITTIFLWTFDWSPQNAYSYFFGGKNSALVIEESGTSQPLPSVIEEPQFPQFETPSSASSSAIDYLRVLRDKGLLAEGKLSTFDASELYESGVPIVYLEALDEANFLDNFSFVDISEFYNSRVPIEYLQSLDQVGYLDQFSFVDITEFYENNVSFQYLDQLNVIGILDELSFVDITEFYTSGVSIDYLRALEENNFLNDFSFVDMTEFYENGVTIEFLNQLKENGLLEDLSFVEIVDLYNAEGN